MLLKALPFFLLILTGCSFAGIDARSELALDSSIPGKALLKIDTKPVKQFMGKLTNPVSNSKLSSSFGWRDGRFHEGLDLSANEGAEVRAAHSGEVVMLREKYSRYGNLVAIRNGALLTVYAHNRKNFVDIGDKVRAGEAIGEVGSTGNATGPHLHFETRVRDSYGRFVAVDPKYFVASRKS